MARSTRHPPGLDHLPCVSKIHEPVLVQAFIPELPVEAFDQCVLRRLAALDEVQRHLILIRPLIHDPAGELCPVIHLDRYRCSASFPQRLQYPHHTQAGQRRVRLDSQGLSRVAIHQVQRSESPPAGQFVMRVVHRPHFIGTRRKNQRHSRFRSKSLAPPTLHRQPFLPVQPIHPLVVDLPPKHSVLALLPSQENVQPPIAESRALGCQLPKPSPQRRFVPFLPPVPPAPAVHPDQPTGASLAEPCLFPHDTHRFSLRPRAYHFFASTTFSASRSRACCATIFFSRPFSSSS